MKFSSVAVTGGTGFLGRHLLKKLLEMGLSIKVLCVKKEEAPGCDTVIGDLRDTASLSELVCGADIVFHLAGQADVEKAEQDRITNFEVNVRGTLNLLECAKEAGTSKIVFASTSHVYGNAENIPVKEDSECRPVTIYGMNKLLAENLCGFYSREGAFGCSIARMSNLYGPGMNVGVLKELIARAKAEGCLTLKSTGEELRDFLHADDAANALVMLAENGSGIFNVGSGRGTHVREAAEIILRETGCKKKLRVGKPRSKDMVLSIEKIKKLGYTPQKQVEAELKAIVHSGSL